jgi:hypothetical protein
LNYIGGLNSARHQFEQNNNSVAIINNSTRNLASSPNDNNSIISKDALPMVSSSRENKEKNNLKLNTSVIVSSHGNSFQDELTPRNSSYYSNLEDLNSARSSISIRSVSNIATYNVFDSAADFINNPEISHEAATVNSPLISSRKSTLIPPISNIKLKSSSKPNHRKSKKREKYHYITNEEEVNSLDLQKVSNHYLQSSIPTV